MLRRWFILLLLVLQLQPVLAFMPEQVVTLAQALAHERIHQEGQGHRHDDALTLGAPSDDDGATLAHVHHDAAHHAVLLPAAATWCSVAAVEGALAVFGPCRIPSPCLDGPLRPPRTCV
ncbi:hypothetical protein C7444_11041 [Sphaerotilus hippei]|uniref:Uncharacterized protein n=1 Tax=Sphaerotilus hippei TaxID=744406 RepID=A0A318H6S1_9BURK|nr:hypothetical protein [Sphaerotilus hippei]PXW95196.1 hypothetical protein C7444_11041 [Sphaerotilus hippei]